MVEITGAFCLDIRSKKENMKMFISFPTLGLALFTFIYIHLESLTAIKKLRPVMAQGRSVTVKSTDCGFDPHSRK